MSSSIKTAAVSQVMCISYKPVNATQTKMCHSCSAMNMNEIPTHDITPPSIHTERQPYRAARYPENNAEKSIITPI